MVWIHVMWSLGPLKNLTFIFLTWTNKKDLSPSVPQAALLHPRSPINLPTWIAISFPQQEMKPLVRSYSALTPFPATYTVMWPVPHPILHPPDFLNDSMPLIPFCHSGQSRVVARIEEKQFSEGIFQSGSIKVAKGNIYNHRGNKQHYYTVDLWGCNRSFQPTNMN